MKLSEKIKMLRKGAGLSQEEFGARLNVSRQAVTKWESGEGLPDIGNLLVLSRMFKVSIDDLLSEEKALAEKLFLYESRAAALPRSPSAVAKARNWRSSALPTTSPTFPALSRSKSTTKARVPMWT